MKAVYTVENLDCPNCAAKIEAAIQRIEGVETASLSYATGQLHITAEKLEGLLERIQAASDAVEEGVIFSEHRKDRAKRYVYRFENIDCPNCAAKIEAAIQRLDCVETASLSYTTGTLHVLAHSEEGLLEAIQGSADSVEEGVIFTPKHHAHSHHHEHEHKHEHEHAHEHHHEHAHHHERDHEHCHCGEHEHEHEHHHEHAHHHEHEHEHDHEHEHHHEHEHEHEHAHEHEHHHEHAHEHTRKAEKRDYGKVTLIAGAALFVLGMAAHFLLQGVVPYLDKVLLMAAYLLLGGQVLLASVKSIGKGQIFDENFLMAIATIGALCIGSWEEAAGVMLFFRIGERFEQLAVERSRKSVMEAIDLRPETVQLLHEGHEETLPAELVQPGDRILVRVGDRIPVDGIVRKGESAVDTSAMTGEPVPVTVREGDAVMSGCINKSGVLELEVTAALQDSMVQRVLDSVENAAAGKPHIDRFITRFARVYTPAVVAVAVLTAVVPPLFNGEWQHWIYTALNFLMISCPCALVLSVPLAFFAGIGAGSTKGILFKDGITIEALSQVKAAVMDKTGTLTEGCFAVTEILAEDETAVLRDCAAIEAFSVHPVAGSILACVKERGIDYPAATDVQERAGMGLIGTVDGRRIAAGNGKLMAAEGISVPEISSVGTLVHVAADGAYCGTLVLSDALRPHAADAVASMNRRGLHTVMLTGDTPAHAQAAASSLGIAEVHAGLLPDEKPVKMEEVRQSHGSVLFIGDGINDAPVLSGADVGMAMGSGADAAMEAADVVLLGSDPAAILTALHISDRVNSTAKFCVIFALAVKLAIMVLGFCGFANMWLSVFADTGVTILCVLFVLLRIQVYYKKHKTAV
ncbi:MAG: cadmium-translocating P-type ATPase [Oscillospiraceae bacterium]|nr:cadmium-translocating P-type ATPase [Oscillospiraceae bacterium]